VHLGVRDSTHTIQLLLLLLLLLNEHSQAACNIQVDF
jgi:hypothetical protein